MGSKTKRFRIQPELAKQMGLEVNKSNRYRLNKDKVDLFYSLKKGNAFEDILHSNNFTPDDNWEYGWMKTKEGSVFVRNPDKNSTVSLDEITSLIKDSISDVKPIKKTPPSKHNKKALRAIISDAHVGMKSDSRDAMFSFEYNDDIFKDNLNVVFENIVNRIDINGNFDEIVVDDLGDGLDGFNNMTTRGGHHLPQNMDNKTAWESYVFNKLDTFVKIINLNAAKKYVFRNVGNCNHSGDIGWMANMAIKMTLEQMYSNVEYHVLERPIEHFYYGKHCFLITHGKDKSLMIKNWPLSLNDKIANLIRQYIDHHNISSEFIHLDKGDLHQVGYSREPRFDYRNFMSFAPPSQWVQSNFGVSYCGFSIQVVPRDNNQIEHTDVFFDLKRI